MSGTTAIQQAENELMQQLQALEPTRRQRVARKLIAAALGAIPWIGGFLAARIAYSDEAQQLEVNRINKEWMAEHERRFQRLGHDLAKLTQRLESLGDTVVERVESEEYMALVRKAFRIYDQADTEEKRDYVCKLLANAAGTKVTEDDVIRLFLDWLEKYHEAHFLVIKEVYHNPGSTRYDIWENIHGDMPRDDSPEADLFRLLIGELSQGRIIRQHRDTDGGGRFLKKQKPNRVQRDTSGTMKSAFDDKEEYELTNLGKQFVHYVLSEAVSHIGGPRPQADGNE